MYKILCSLFISMLLATGGSAQSPYRVKAGDTLQVEVVEDTNLNRQVLVLPDGSISFPLVGNIPAAGRTVDQVRAALSSGLASNFASPPNVYVSIGSLAPRVVGTAAALVTQGVFVTGEIASAGRLDVEPGTTVLQAIAQAGGLTPFAAGKRIQLRREDSVYRYNYYSAGSDGGSISSSTVLAPGDVIVVPQRRLFE
ncbi:polysaccharide biosynthesis/export family protein [Pseudohalocynthiibacter sp. F2068]|jgi:protein involved in polysaccharide export with SLBB domain|uniref:polysaccharide biosynthesis/export family protein n=1 Tax=Pseudohalocynthiibacter sp. F2068 TaxID=2926418 RepID=UPI001FF5DDBE|nr:polysaccharide biosynthesis/export family protein [Pseudohalocynthiibacter sp. F2068]MCK0103872.1 polysaccharide export protein [Pseudohalocynthiibacter sp. F2068]